MAKLFCLVAALLAGCTVADKCADNVTTAAVNVIDNTTFLDTCSPGATWKLTNLFEVPTLSANDFFTWCNATTCMDELHELLHTLPECNSTYNGSSVILVDEIAKVHDACHAIINKVEGSKATMDMDDDETSDTDTAASAASNTTKATVPSPSPTSTTKSAAVAVAVSSKTLTAVIAATAALAALVL